MFCLQCHESNKPKKMTPGNFLIEICLYFFFFFPGIIYTAWRITSKKLICPICKSEQLVPEDSRIAQKFQSEEKAL